MDCQRDLPQIRFLQILCRFPRVANLTRCSKWAHFHFSSAYADRQWVKSKSEVRLWQCFYKGFSVPSVYSGSGMRSITLLAPSCATGQDLRPCVKKPRWQSCGVAATGKLQGSGATELATGNRERPVGHSALPQAHRGVHFNRSGIASAKAVLLTINCSAFQPPIPLQLKSACFGV